MTAQSARLKNSVYTPEEERGFAALLFTFRDFIDKGQDSFEVMYSEKLGKYIEVIMEKLLWRTEPLWELDGPDDLFYLFLCQMGVTLASPRWDTEFEGIGPEFNIDELAEVRRQTEQYLTQMPDKALRAHYTALMEKFITEQTAKAERYVKSNVGGKST